MYKIRSGDQSKLPIVFSKDRSDIKWPHMLSLTKELANISGKDSFSMKEEEKTFRLRTERKMAAVANFGLPIVFNWQASVPFLEGKDTISNNVVGEKSTVDKVIVIGKEVSRITRSVSESLSDEDCYIMRRLGSSVIIDITTFLMSGEADSTNMIEKIEKLFERVILLLEVLDVPVSDVLGGNKNEVLKLIRDKNTKLTDIISGLSFSPSMKNISIPMRIDFSRHGFISTITILKLKDSPPFNREIKVDITSSKHSGLIKTLLKNMKRDTFTLETLAVPIELTSSQKKVIPVGMESLVLKLEQLPLNWSH
jgi:hypothetical protein